ncbi:MAG: hypothetical protein ACPGUC_06485 [Gammaproteobacteria bacterium]
MAEHDARISDLYRRGPRAEPRAYLDDAIRAAAAESVGTGRADPRRSPRRPGFRWMFPLATAASVLLSVGLLLRMGPELPGGLGPDAPSSEQVDSGSSRAGEPLVAADDAGVEAEAPPDADPATSTPRHAVPLSPPPAVSRQAPSVEVGAAREEREASGSGERLRAPESDPKAATAGRLEAHPAPLDIEPDSQREKRKAAAPRPAPNTRVTADGLMQAAPRSERRFSSADVVSAPSGLPVAIDQNTPVEGLIESLRGAPEERWLEAIDRLEALGRVRDAEQLRAALRRPRGGSGVRE